MTSVNAVAILFWSALAASTVCIATDLQLRVILGTYWKRLAFIVLLTLAWRIPLDGVFFHGLEYEDSYIYTVAGRQMAGNVATVPGNPNSPYSINVCEIGSLKDCQKWEPFVEHLTGYPYVISVFSRLFGYTSSAGSIVNLIAAGFTSLLAFCIALEISFDLNVATMAGVIFACTPVFAVYGIETSAEPFSCACLTLMLWFYVRLCDGEELKRSSTFLRWFAFSTALLFAQTVKREDLLPALILPLLTPFLLQQKRRKVIGILVATTSALALILAAGMHLQNTLSNEDELVKQFPMTASHLVAFVAGFLRSFMVFKWYAGTVFLAAAGLFIACRRRGIVLIPAVLLFAYVFLYACHIRSYDEMQSGAVEPQTALRFSMNFMGPWAIVAGLGTGSILTKLAGSHLWKTRRPWLRLSTAIVAAAALAMSFIYAERLRDYEVEDETISRLTPARSAVHLARHPGGGPDLIITMEPLLIQMYAGPEVRIADLESVTPEELKLLMPTSGGNQLIFLDETDHQSDTDLTRYGPQMAYLRSLSFDIMQNDKRFQILSLHRDSKSRRNVQYP